MYIIFAFYYFFDKFTLNNDVCSNFLRINLSNFLIFLLKKIIMAKIQYRPN